VQLSQDTVTVSSSLPWTGTLLPVLYGGCSALTVPSGVRLTLGAGTIVKGQANSCAYLNVQGSLVASGTSASPVTLTSWRDDSVGGDTNGDGNATGPQKGDWGGISSSPAGNGNPNPTVDLERVKISYASTALSTNQTTTSIRASVVDRANGDGINVTSPVGVPTVSGNTVTSAAGTAVNVLNANVDMGALNGNSGSGNGLNGVQFSQARLVASSSLPWTGTLLPVLYGGCSALTVPAGVTLTLGAGTIIKAQSNSCAYLNVQGGLVANGTGANPVTLTSWRDDTIGGDTNGDGNATGPQKGDWGGVASSPAGAGNPDPVVDVDRVHISYASTALSTNQTTTSIRNSSVDLANGDGINVTSPAGMPIVSGNAVTNAAGTAVSILNANVDMASLDGNSGSGNGLNGVQFSLATVRASSSLPWSGTLLPVLYGGCSALTVAPGVTLTLGPGTIMKAQSNGCAYLNVQGKLLSSGTAANPATITSWRDDTIGGDTNGDGNATGPQRGDWGGVASSPAGAGNDNPTLDLDHVTLRYPAIGISANQTTTSIKNSVIDRVNGDGINVTSPVGVPTVSGNTVTNAASTAINILGANVDMGALNGNSGSGNGLNGVQFSQVTVTASSRLPWTGNLVPVIAQGCSSLTVPPHVTLTLGPGAIIKAQPCTTITVQGTLTGAGSAGNHAVLTSVKDDTVGGDTNGDGNANPPATGDWGGVLISAPGNGNPDPAVQLDNTEVRYATTGVNVGQLSTVRGDNTTLSNNMTGISVQVGGTAALSASRSASAQATTAAASSPTPRVAFTNSLITHSTTGIAVYANQSAAYQGRIVLTELGADAPSGAQLDVRNVDWGNPNGPAPWGDGTRVQGQGLLVYPWAGAPALPPPAAEPAPQPGPCADVLMIGVDGSSQSPPQTTVDSEDNPVPLYGEMRNLYGALRDGLAPDRKLRVMELEYPADHVEELVAGWLGWGWYYQSYVYGLTGGGRYPGLVPTVKAEFKRCPDEKLVLAGTRRALGSFTTRSRCSTPRRPKRSKRLGSVGSSSSPIQSASVGTRRASARRTSTPKGCSRTSGGH
jgi:hypothetical protein